MAWYNITWLMPVPWPQGRAWMVMDEDWRHGGQLEGLSIRRVTFMWLKSLNMSKNQVACLGVVLGMWTPSVWLFFSCVCVCVCVCVWGAWGEMLCEAHQESAGASTSPSPSQNVTSHFLFSPWWRQVKKLQSGKCSLTTQQDKGKKKKKDEINMLPLQDFKV